MPGESSAKMEQPSAMLTLERNPWRADFPVLEQTVHGKPLVYLDNAATSQKPRSVIEAVTRHYAEECSNVHRGIHLLSARATIAFEEVREKARDLIGAASSDEIIFTSGTTGAINLVAHSFGQRFIEAGDEIVITELEHHSNIVPWQLLCERSGARLRVVPINDVGELELETYEELLGERTRLVAVTHTSNALGTCTPLPRIIAAAHKVGARVLVDAAQAMIHGRVDVRELDCDLLAFSGHKAFGPTGIGVLYGKMELLRELPPFIGGGEMIETVGLERSTFKEPPHRFEAGTPHIAGVIGFGTAIDYLQNADLDRMVAHDQALLREATERLARVSGVRIIGTAREKSSILSFVIEGIHAHDAGQWLDDGGVAVRAGQHCAQPVMDHFALPSTVRASFACYNTLEDVNRLIDAVERTIEVLG